MLSWAVRNKMIWLDAAGSNSEHVIVIRHGSLTI